MDEADDGGGEPGRIRSEEALAQSELLALRQPTQAGQADAMDDAELRRRHRRRRARAEDVRLAAGAHDGVGMGAREARMTGPPFHRVLTAHEDDGQGHQDKSSGRIAVSAQRNQ
jgi:hypothetical protein